MIFTKKRCFALVFFITLIFLISEIVIATNIGVSPAVYEVDFKPGLEKKFIFNFRIEQANSGLQIYKEGDLAEYVALNTHYLHSSGSVSVYLRLPDKIEPPGLHIIHIGALETPKTKKQGMTIVGNIVGSIKIFVPYPGKYVESEIIAKDVKYGEITNFILKISGKGSEDVLTKNRLEVYDPQNKLIKTFDLGEYYLKSGETKTFETEFDTIGYKMGKYKVIAISEYDGKETKKETFFRIGEIYIEIINHSNNFLRGRINKFDIEIESFWNDPIENVFAEVLIPDYNIIFRTPSITLKGFGKAVLTGYFDTTSIPVEVNKIRASINVYYLDKRTNKIVKLDIINEKNYTTHILIGIIGLLVLVLIALTILDILSYKKLKNLKNLKSKKKNEKKKQS